MRARLLLLLTGALMALSLPLAAGGRAELITQLDREVLALKERIRVLEERLATCDRGDLAPAVYTELRQVFSGTHVEVVRRGQRTIVRVPGGLLFGRNSVLVRSEAAMVLDLIATALALHPESSVQIVGHTDDQPPGGGLSHRFRTNWELSAVRAAAVMHTLTTDFSLPPERFTVSGRGELDPLAENDTPAGRHRNHRIEVVIFPPGARP